jgi:hypothetical protein
MFAFGDKFDTKPILDKKFICSGIIAGGINEIIITVNEFLKRIHLGEQWHDQGYINYMVFSGTYERLGVKVEPPRKEDFIRHTFGYRILEKSFGNITGIHDNNTLATIVHHTHTFSSDLKKDIFTKCPVSSITVLWTYFPRCNLTCAEKYINK